MLKERELIEVSTNGRRRKCRARVDNLSMQGRQSGEAESPKCLHSKQDREQPRKQLSKAKPKLQDVRIYFVELGMSIQDGENSLTTTKATDGNKGVAKPLRIESRCPQLATQCKTMGYKVSRV